MLCVSKLKSLVILRIFGWMWNVDDDMIIIICVLVRFACNEKLSIILRGTGSHKISSSLIMMAAATSLFVSSITLMLTQLCCGYFLWYLSHYNGLASFFITGEREMDTNIIYQMLYFSAHNKSHPRVFGGTQYTHGNSGFCVSYM